MVDRITPDSPRWHHYCDNAFDVMNSVKRKWRNPLYKQRPILRLLYCDVSSCGYCVNNPHLISENAMNNILLYGASATDKKKKTVKDHAFSPQFVSRFIFDNQEVYLNDWELFKSVFYDCCLVTIVTSEENDALAQLTLSDDDKNTFKVKVPTYKKYDHVGIKLFKYEGTCHWKDREFTPVPNTALNVPSYLTEYEKEYLV